MRGDQRAAGGEGGMKRFRAAGQEDVHEVESINMANVLVFLSQGSSGGGGEEVDPAGPPHPSRVFECKTCNRQFPSFQALGGHRASHKKPRLGGEHSGDQVGHPPAAPARPRVHECAICGLEFPIGQALGGHMRRHRAAPDGSAHALGDKKAAAAAARSSSSSGSGGSGGSGGQEKRSALCLDLDLNRPPADNGKDFLTLNLALGLPMVDCFH